VNWWCGTIRLGVMSTEKIPNQRGRHPPSFHVGKKEGWFMSDLFGLLNPRYAVLSLGTFLIVLAVVYT
jgi:hypothetical protein